MNTARTQKYVALIRQFLDQGISAEVFERQYLDLFKNESPGMSIAEFSVLERLFTAVDAYCPDPSLRSEGDLDEAQLREVAQSTLSKLLAQ
ncbi:MAG: hypothetical protein HYS12_19070 [Planctomycetes bacterium]|nr:hypothetical protein [Planctomycetota bacterium]